MAMTQQLITIGLVVSGTMLTSFFTFSTISGSHGIPELLSIALVIGLHSWKRQMLLSIAGLLYAFGTVFIVRNEVKPI